MPHSHHTHHPSHHHAHSLNVKTQYGKAFFISVLLNILFVLTEFAYGILAHSLALIADAWHNVGDVLGLLLAWGTYFIATKQPTARFTYGLGSSTILAALTNACLLLLVTGGIAWEALQRLHSPAPVHSTTVMVVASIGIAVNGISAWLFWRGHSQDINIRGAFLHLAADAGVSLAVVISGLVIALTGWYRLDALMSLGVAVVICISGWNLLKDSLSLVLHGVPKHISQEEVLAYLSSLEEVESVHDLHIWAIGTTDVALSVHLLMKAGHPGDKFYQRVTEYLQHSFRISHATIQIELGDAATCALTHHH